MVKVENDAPARWRKPPANGYSLHPRQAHLSSTLLCLGIPIASRPEERHEATRRTRAPEPKSSSSQTSRRSCSLGDVAWSCVRIGFGLSQTDS